MTVEQNYILACIDGSDLGNTVVEYAIYLAKNSQLPLKFLHTIEHSYRTEHAHHEGTLTPNLKEQLLDELSDEERAQSKQLIAEGKVLLNRAQQMAEQAGLTQIIAKQRHGTLPEALTDLEAEISMVVLGAKGEDHQGNKKALGSQLEQAIRAIHTPVFIVKDEHFTEPEKILFAYNGSPTSRKALELIKQAVFYPDSIDVHLVIVSKNSSEADLLIGEAKVSLSEAKITVISQVLSGEPVESLIEYQQKNAIDTTVMGAFSHGKVHGLFFGSFTTRMLLESNTNFLLIR